MTARYTFALALAVTWLGVSSAGATNGPGGEPGPADRTEAVVQIQPDPAAQALPGAAAPVLVSASDGAHVLAVDFDVPLTPSLFDALARGVPLYFVAEFELQRPRWWWFDAVVVERSLSWRLAYHALTRQYRLTQGGIIQPFDSIEEALRTMSRVRGWRVIEAGEVEPGVGYEAQVRLRLDTTQLPKPFQIGSLASRDWNPESEWKRFRFTAPIPKSGQ